ncbi:hypothetical protein OHB02_29685 [Streptomyces albidoflavus]|uniref:hypothetical protein n=1 Tax=Streptomyces albidoflavus TaxID=1886 RepID=UPI0030919714|nr:hypothetical protein OHB02_00510 [Streptomyces albidoflavus]WSB24061.1 hypothetical protein OHB02_29685 [Streptomyces albidoflavus]
MLDVLREARPLLGRGPWHVGTDEPFAAPGLDTGQTGELVRAVDLVRTGWAAAPACFRSTGTCGLRPRASSRAAAIRQRPSHCREMKRDVINVLAWSGT